MKTILILTVLLSTACSTMKHNIKKNNVSTDRTVENLLKKNGNVFYLQSTHATFSSVWTYTDNYIKIYKLANGKLIDQKEYTTDGIDKFILSSQQISVDFQQCLEIDGDILGFRIREGEEVQIQKFFVDIECFRKGKYTTELLNKIVKDINVFKIWDVYILNE